MTGAERQRRFIHRLRARVTLELEKARKRIAELEAELSDARQEVARMRAAPRIRGVQGQFSVGGSLASSPLARSMCP